MYIKQVVLAIAIIFGTVVSCLADQKIENRVGPFDLTDAPITESKLISQFGQGHIQADKVHGKVLGQQHTYYISNVKVWVDMRFSHVLDENLERVLEEILISRKKLCDERFEPEKPFGLLITSKGIKIGDSIDKVISIYGKPSISIEIRKNKLFSVLGEELKLQKGRVLRYLSQQPDELLFAEFYFDEDGLH